MEVCFSDWFHSAPGRLFITLRVFVGLHLELLRAPLSGSNKYRLATTRGSTNQAVILLGSNSALTRFDSAITARSKRWFCCLWRSLQVNVRGQLIYKYDELECWNKRIEVFVASDMMRARLSATYGIWFGCGHLLIRDRNFQFSCGALCMMQICRAYNICLAAAQWKDCVFFVIHSFIRPSQGIVSFVASCRALSALPSARSGIYPWSAQFGMPWLVAVFGSHYLRHSVCV